MRVADHAEARHIIHRDHLRVKEVATVRGGMRYNCITPGKKRERRAITIFVPAGAPQVKRPTRKELNK